MEHTNWFEITYTFLGGIGIFFFGMKYLSESLQAIAGNLIRKVINALTTNRIMAVLVGTLVTAIIQSSSVTTVMVVGFVNAGLMELTQAIGVTLGANIGTTITGWIIAIKVGKYGLLFIGLGAFPMLFSKKRLPKNLGGILVALGFVFMGLELMSEAFKPLRSNQSFISLLHYFAADSYLSVYACIMVGCLLTFAIQSSSAMLGITIALASTGVITYQTAVALVFGENIGTTVTALLASIGTNSTAKRAARAHACFNVFGCIMVSTFFWPYIAMVDRFIPGIPDFIGADGSKPFIAAHIAAAHSGFNVLNVLLFLPFIQYLAKFVTWITPAPKKKEIPHLKFLPAASGDSPAITLTASEKELKNMGDILERLFDRTRNYVLSSNPSDEDYDKIHHAETVLDSIQAEITVFLCHVQEAKLTQDQTATAYAQIRAADELESISDYLEAIARYRKHLDSKGQALTGAAAKELEKFFNEVHLFYSKILKDYKEDAPINVKEVRYSGNKISEEGNVIRKNHRRRLEAGECTAVSGMLFSDMIVGLRKIKGHVINFAEALAKTDFTDPDNNDE